MQAVLKAGAVVFLASVVGYLVAWYAGKIVGNFPLLLLVVTGFTGVYWLLEKFWLLPQRKRAVVQAQQRWQQAEAKATAQGVQMSHADRDNELRELSHMPWWMDWTGALFPVIAVVFLLRSFAYEPFKIPTSSMVPTLLPGDFILVDKFSNGLRLPVWHTKMTEGTAPQRGDVMVFRYPPDPKVDYIKRVIGLPGDTVRYENKQLSINGKPLALEEMSDYLNTEDEILSGQPAYMAQAHEVLPVADADGGTTKHSRVLDAGRQFDWENIGSANTVSGCTYFAGGLECTVPEGQYFMMGDNRDHSADSRFWGFVPEKNIVGKAVLVWMNFSEFGRIGTKP